ncbi:hypothetical protein [Synechococcus sp. CCY 9618]|uniref:hypothetical protein n=1 Tax=Synechococcus sp. CCY 9618 TaxID=2815602 RepID=UPI001C21CD4E|nr:hypothetical protein [Synechococcus sp. CCY 9618]
MQARPRSAEACAGTDTGSGGRPPETAWIHDGIGYHPWAGFTHTRFPVEAGPSRAEARSRGQACP